MIDILGEEIENKEPLENNLNLLIRIFQIENKYSKEEKCYDLLFDELNKNDDSTIYFLLFANGLKITLKIQLTLVDLFELKEEKQLDEKIFILK